MKKMLGLFLFLTLLGTASAAGLEELPITYKEYNVTVDQGEKVTLVATTGIYMGAYKKSNVIFSRVSSDSENSDEISTYLVTQEFRAYPRHFPDGVPVKLEDKATLDVEGKENWNVVKIIAPAELTVKIEKKKKTKRKPGIPTKFSCSKVDGIGDWVIYIDLNKGLAGFFDNDATAIVPLTNSLVLESHPPQTTYIFEGKDTTGGSKDRLQIDFNHTKLSASVTFINRTDRSSEDRTTLKARDKCVPNDKININLEE